MAIIIELAKTYIILTRFLKIEKLKPEHYIYFSMLYITIFCFITQYKQLDTTFKILFVYLIFLALCNSLAMFVRLQFQVKNNLYIGHVLTPIEYVLLSLIYYRSLKNMLLKKIIIWSMYGFVITCVLLTLYSEKLAKLDSTAKIIETLLITFWIVSYFYQILTPGKIMNLQTDPLFWMNVGLLIYFIGNLFITGYLNTLIEHHRDVALRLYQLGYLLEFNLFIQITIALYCRRIF